MKADILRMFSHDDGTFSELWNNKNGIKVARVPVGFHWSPVQCDVRSPQIWSPQQDEFTSTPPPLHTGTKGCLGAHSSIRVRLLHVHWWQLDSHTSPGWIWDKEKGKCLSRKLSLYIFIHSLAFRRGYWLVWVRQVALCNLQDEMMNSLRVTNKLHSPPFTLKSNTICMLERNEILLETQNITVPLHWHRCMYTIGVHCTITVILVSYFFIFLFFIIVVISLGDNGYFWLVVAVLG